MEQNPNTAHSLLPRCSNHYSFSAWVILPPVFSLKSPYYFPILYPYPSQHKSPPFPRPVLVPYYLLFCLTMEEELTNLWNGLTLTEDEASTIKIEPENLISPINALVHRLAVRKFVSLYDLEKGLRSAWDLKTPLEITQVGDNLYIFELVHRKICERVFNRQPWTFRGSLILLDRFRGNERPEDINLRTAPVWVQAHGLQLRAMLRGVGEKLGRLLGEVVDVRSDYDGAAMGWCVRIKAIIDVDKPLCRWTSVDIEGETYRIIFRYEKIVDLCFYCGRLNYLDKDCGFIPSNWRKYYGTWIRVAGQDPIPVSEIAAELDRLNLWAPDHPLEQTPKTPTSRNLELVPQSKPDTRK